MKFALLMTLAACGATPVVGTWEALNVSLENGSVDLTEEFTATTISSKAVVYNGSTAYSTTIFTGTYTWLNKEDGTHVFTSYSGQSITGPNGTVQPLDTVCTDQGNCEGYKFRLTEAQTNDACVCKKQERVFQVNGGTMNSTYGGKAVTYQHPR